jgi:hypothetical protein
MQPARPEKLTTAPKAFLLIAKTINQLIAFCLPLSAGTGIKITHSAENILIDASELAERTRNLENQILNTPFRIIPADGVAAVLIIPGDVENIVPEIGGTSIAAIPPPQLSVSSGPVYLECTMDAAGTLTAAEIKNAGSLPADTSTLRYRQIGTVSVSGTIVIVTTQTVRTSVSHKLCGGLSTWGTA